MSIAPYPAVLLAALLAFFALPAAAQLPPPEGFPIASPHPERPGAFGAAVAAAGDVNGDGVSDILIGAPFESSGAFEAGRAYVVSGGDGAPLLTLASPNALEQGSFGGAVAGVGDVDGDGVPDLAVGASEERGGIGSAYVFSGADGTLVHDLVSPTPQSFFGSFGQSIAGLGDVDGDGAPDLVVGAYGEGDGHAHVFSGAAGGLLHTLVPPNTADHTFGYTVSGIDDVSGDGVADVVTRASGSFPTPVYVFSGASGALVRTMTSPDPDWGGFGFALAGVSDVNGDAVPDVFVGAEGEDGGAIGAGRAYVFSGANGALIHTLTSPGPTDFGLFGAAVGEVGDVDGDGTPDLAVGASQERRVTGQGPRVGQVYVFSGATGALLHTIIPPFPDGDGRFGEALAGAGAAGGGASGLIIGAPGEDGGAEDAGRAYLLTFPRPVATEPPPGPTTGVTAAPNPFQGRTTLSFVLAEPAGVRLALYDALGREMAVLVDGHLPSGPHTVSLEASRWPAGTYGFRLVVGERVETGRLTRLR